MVFPLTQIVVEMLQTRNTRPLLFLVEAFFFQFNCQLAKWVIQLCFHQWVEGVKYLGLNFFLSLATAKLPGQVVQGGS